jgi:hypothetical protein
MSVFTFLLYAALAALAAFACGVAALMVVCHASQPAAFERPASHTLRIVDRPLLGLELLLGNAACLVSCARHAVHAAFRNREVARERAAPSADAALAAAIRLCAWTGDRAAGRALGADRLGRMLRAVQDAAMQDAASSTARLARAIEKTAAAVASLAGRSAAPAAR